MRKIRRSRLLVTAGLLLALAAGCSTNAVSQSAATTFFNALATNTVTTLFGALFPK
jgi:hypothetical protein